jgi:hypothetical protein
VGILVTHLIAIKDNKNWLPTHNTNLCDRVCT